MIPTTLPLYPFDPKYTGDTDGFTFNLAGWLGDVDQIAGTPTATVTPAGVTIEAVIVSGGYVTVWLSGGVAGQTYTIEIRVVTTSTPARNCAVRGAFAVIP